MTWREPLADPGRDARDWDRVFRGDERGARASIRRTTSSRYPGRVFVGVVYDSPVTFRALHLCACGQKQRRCDECGEWVCEAPGHARHVCSGGRYLCEDKP